MNKTIKIGFLFPYSSIFPNMSQDIIDGILSVFPAALKNRIQFYPEYVDLGQTENVKTAFQKLLAFHHVDIMSGIISYKLLPEIVQFLGDRQKLGIFFDMGENIPPAEALPAPVFANSLALWKQEFALGNWAQKNFGGKGAILMSTYDAGYHLHTSFWQGAMEAGAEEIDMHTLPYFEDVSKSISAILPPFFEKIETAKANFLHALFCGNETNEFYKAFRNSSLYKKIPLIVSPPMAIREVLVNIEMLNISVYSTSGWDFSSGTASQHPLIINYKNTYGKPASVFAVMGMEAGMAIKAIFPELEKGDTGTALKILRETAFEGPRGNKSFKLYNFSENNAITIEKYASQNPGSSSLTVGEFQLKTINPIAINTFHAESESGWKNPYLCI
ncbi:MAG: ABC transporter substrate-binding protein [Draconibacterium sp.]